MPDEQRYILRHNPARADEIAGSRDSKYAALSTAVYASNFPETHSCAKPNTRPHKDLSAGWYNTQLKNCKAVPDGRSSIWKGMLLLLKKTPTHCREHQNSMVVKS